MLIVCGSFNFFVVNVKYLCEDTELLSPTFSFWYLLGCFLSLQCNWNVVSSFQMSWNQNSHSIQTNSHKIQTDIYNSVIEYLTLQMQGSAVPQPWKCKVSEFQWKLANARVSVTAQFNYKIEKQNPDFKSRIQTKTGHDAVLHWPNPMEQNPWHA